MARVDLRRVVSLFSWLFLSLCCFTMNAKGQNVQVRVENLMPANGFYITPMWVGFHDGTFDYFNSGSAASAALEMLAEEGDVSGLVGDFGGSGTQGTVFGPAGFGGAPVIDPGEVAVLNLTVPTNQRFFSYGSMIIPSNDGFFGNDSPTSNQVFDASGNFTPVTFTRTLAQLWDSGTEVNDTLGSPFSLIGGMSSSEGGVVQLHPGLNNFFGTGTVAGTTLGNFSASSEVFRVTISSIPEPSSALAWLGLGMAYAIRRHRSRPI
jgi:hypothetical protein